MFIKHLHILFVLIVFNFSVCTGVFVGQLPTPYVAKYKADKQSPLAIPSTMHIWTLHLFSEVRKLGFKATFWVNCKLLKITRVT